MKRFVDLLNEKVDSLLAFFDEVYVFGSCLYKETPSDVDLLLVYDQGRILSDVVYERQRILENLSLEFKGATIDLTTLSKRELAETGFLERVSHRQIKG